MRLSKDATGSGVGRNGFCFTCGIHGHFERDCPQMTKQKKDARATDQLAQQALQERAQKLIGKPTATPATKTNRPRASSARRRTRL